MIYLHQSRSFVMGQDTGYGRAFSDFYLACVRGGMMMVGHPIDEYHVECPIEVDLYFGMPQPCFREFYSCRYDGSIKGVFTMHESTKVRDEYIPEINEYFDFIMVPSDYCLESFRKQFPHIPVYKCPLGLNGNEFPYYNRLRDRKLFTFLWNGFTMCGRKGDMLCVQAFQELKLNNSRLIIKSMPNATTLKLPFHLTASDGLGVQYACYPYTQAELYSLYCDSDVGLHPSSSEGFGMVPLEMMATGLPMIMTDCTASEEQFDEADCLRVKTNLTTDWAIKDGTVGHVADVESLKEQMLYAYEHQEEMRERGRAAAERVRRDFSWEMAAFTFEKIINQVKEGSTNGKFRNQGTGATAGQGEPCGYRS